MHHQGESREPARRTGDAVPPPTPYARSYWSGDTVVVELSGELDLGTAEFVEPHLEGAASAPQPAGVVLDLGRLEFVDCFGLSLLVRTRRRILDRGGRLRMVCGHPPTRKLLALTGLDDVFRPVGSLAEALER